MDKFKKVPGSKRFLRALKILVLNLFLFPFRLGNIKKLINRIYELEPYPAEESNIKDVYLEDIFPGICKNKIELYDLESKYGSMTVEEIYNVALIVKHINPKVIFEFGTFIGVTTLQLASNSDSDSKIYTLNLSSTETKTKYSIGRDEEEKNLPSLQPGNRFRDTEFAGKIHQLYGDSAEYDFSEFEGKVDLILVDASHEYAYVKSDTENAIKMLKKGGSILWHDYPNSPGVYNYLNEISDKITICHIKDTHLACAFIIEAV